MRILIPTADYPPIEGGIGTVALQVARELARLGHEVTVVAPYFAGMEDFDRAEPVTVIRYKGYGAGWLRLAPMFAKSWPLLRKTDLVLGINISYGGLIGWLGQKRFRVPYLTFAYAYEFLKFRHNPLASALLRRIYARSAAAIAISSYSRDRLVEFGVPANRVRVIHPGANPAPPPDPEAVRAIKHKFVLDTDHVILAVGRMIRRKNHVALVKAMPRVLERFPDAVLIVVGQGPTMMDTVHAAWHAGVREHVIFPGRLSDEETAMLYDACEVFALPTGQDGRGQVEGFGLVFAEAHAHGKPVVAGRSGGVADAVIDGETGLLVDPSQPHEIADAILRLMADPEFARRLGENGRRRVKKELNWRQFTIQLLEAATQAGQT
ncbi:MAG: glycosyltransferase family 4 protein [Candidatus Hydrogenedentes bacterium]|nr:glycosyltransferase family 4 protein [Candidatus Hydrogenedentota bacterium]